MKTVQEIAENCIAEIRNAMSESGSDASGCTSAGLSFTDDGEVLTIKSNRGGFANVERGQEAGKRPFNFVEIIYNWTIDKGINPLTIKPYRGKKYGSAEENARWQMAGAMAFVNRSEGSLLHKNGGRIDIYTPAIDNLMKEIAIFAKEDVKVKILKTLKL